MKIYLAARYSRRDEMRSVRERLQGLGHTVTSRWLDTNWEGKDDTGSSHAPPALREQFAFYDFANVQEADCLIAFTEEGRHAGRGGRHVELGIALGQGKRIFVVGWRENIFHHLPCVVFFHNLNEVMQFLAGEGKPS